jgi:tRNA-dihydrouridine synthase 3
MATSESCEDDAQENVSFLTPISAVSKPGMALLKSEFIHKKKVESNNEDETNDLPPSKKAKKRGQNKSRPHLKKVSYSKQLCGSVRIGQPCSYGEECRYLHSVKEFMEIKSANIGPDCVFYSKYGECPYGLACRFGEKHISEDFKNVTSGDYFDRKLETTVHNTLSKLLQEKLRKRKLSFPRSCIYLESLKKQKSSGTHLAHHENPNSEDVTNFKTYGPVTNEESVKLQPAEQKTIEFQGKLYLAPLTTVGNLPFRRVCKEFGADITCGEMALCTNLLQGQQSEWALIKRHESEDVFGAQICGGFPDTMSKCAEMLCEYTKVDFIDINCGCPIDLIYNSGAGSALMRRSTRLQEIVLGMKSVMDVPLTLKMRTGVYDKCWNAHSLIPNLREWGVDLVTVHGRSREQRYTKKADYDYIKLCSEAAAPMPIFGNGDVLSYEDYQDFLAKSQVNGLMIGR